MSGFSAGSGGVGDACTVDASTTGGTGGASQITSKYY